MTRRASAAISEFSDLDPVTEDLLIGHLADLERLQWFVREHHENTEGDVMHRET